MQNINLVAIAFAACLAPSALAQEASGIPAPNAEARAEMALLAPIAGEWQARILTPDEQGGWRELGTERQTIHYLLNDLALREAAPEHALQGWRLESTLQYDHELDVFRLVAIDDTWGRMDVYEGGWAAPGVLQLDNVETGHGFTSDSGQSYFFRLTTTIIDRDHNVFQVDLTPDRGESWLPYQRAERARVGSES